MNHTPCSETPNGMPSRKRNVVATERKDALDKCDQVTFKNGLAVTDTTPSKTVKSHCKAVERNRLRNNYLGEAKCTLSVCVCFMW